MRADSASLAELLPLRLVSKAAHLQWRVLVLPWTTFLYWLSCCASLLMRFLILTGAPPAEFYSKAKLKEVMNVIDHLHQREDTYRQKIKELSEDVEIQKRDKKRALAKLNKLRAEVGIGSSSCAEGEGSGELHAGGTGALGLGSGGFGAEHARRAGLGARWGMHVSVVLVTIAALLFFERGDSPALSRKIVSSIIFPTWFAWVYSFAPRSPTACANGIYCASWFLLGFLFHQWTRLG